MIYRAEDKSNDRLDRRCMRRFRAFIDAVELEELNLVGRRFTWSSEQDQPTLEWLDRVFATAGWLQAHPNHVLRALSTDCSGSLSTAADGKRGAMGKKEVSV